jgi:hypothetical protein
MHNAVGGCNYASKKSDMMATPKDNMDTSANTMQNHIRLKTKTHKVAFARNLNSMPLYVHDGFGHSVEVLSQLRTKARHIIIQQAVLT